ncbi:MAG: hypothetical protein JW914_04030 [Syntrophaceae bacterium]|nr:hypothetical protein [Syntrophaceae bacterium]
MKKQKIIFLYYFFIVIFMFSCGIITETSVIDTPDEYRKTYEAKEDIVLRAIARVFQERQMGLNVTINRKDRTVVTDYFIRDDWRTKSLAKVKQINWKETETVITIITEKKTKTGWQMVRVLKKDQYANLFSEIELRIYEEMAKIE